MYCMVVVAVPVEYHSQKAITLKSDIDFGSDGSPAQAPRDFMKGPDGDFMTPAQPCNSDGIDHLP